MRGGNWVPVSKSLVKYLPKDRAYTELEAAYSLQLDYDNDKSVTVSGSADLWGWSRKRVKNFLNRMGIKIIYPENTSEKQNQRGQIGLQIRDRSGTDKGQIRLIDSRDLRSKGNRKGTDKGQIRDRSGNTTRDPNPNPNLLKGAEAFSLPSKDEINDSSIIKLDEDLLKICTELKNENIFPEAFAFMNQKLKKYKNHRAILHTLSRCYLKKTFKEGGPWAYCEKILQAENGNYNEADHQKTT